MIAREPFLSRAYVVAGAVFAAMVTIGMLPGDGEPSAFLLAGIPLAIATLIGGKIVQWLPRNRRREIFTVARGGFLALPAASPGLECVLSLMTAGVLGALVGANWPPEGFLGWAALVATVLITLLAVSQSILAWPARHVALTPAGIQWRSPLYRRLVPWDALARGGPAVPSLVATRIPLEVISPESVVVRGMGFLSGSAARPAVVTGQLDVHPRLMAAAIRWYAEHPEDRAAIGTSAEHERLRAALAA